MAHKIKEILFEFIYIFLNNCVNKIPVWFIRRLFYRLFGMKIGKKSRILMQTIVVSPWKIRIGNGTTINEYCFLDGRGGLDIGVNTTIAIYSKIISATHDIDSDDFSYREEKVTIGDNVAIFADSVILPGTTVENGCVFAAGSIVKRDVYKENGVYGGNPAKKIRERRTTDFNIKPWEPWFR